MPPLDPRAPLVLDTHELGRRPGAEREIVLAAPAPTELGVDVLNVPAESPIELSLRLESVMEGVLVTGTASVALAGECVRCLTDIDEGLTVDLQELYLYDGDDAEDEETSRMDGELLDLEPVVRDAVVLSLPQNPLCRPDCPGLCTQCGARLADDPDHGHGEVLDPRWAALEGLAVGDEQAPADTKE
ncbi:MAG: YceD family protein [Nocardioidaceae bacterium]